MQSEIDLLRQRVSELKAENAEVKAENVKLKQLIKPKVPPPPTQGDLSIKDYFRIFKAYIICLGVSPDGEFAKEQFINGLSAESKAKIPTTNEVLPYISYYNVLIRYKGKIKETSISTSRDDKESKANLFAHFLNAKKEFRPSFNHRFQFI